MNLTNSHIKELYKFTKQHYVEHYDVQTELVDHLANDIEHIWKENPKFTFEQARDNSFKKFGVCGFMDVVEEKQKALNTRYRKLVWQSVKEYFSIPKIVITIILIFAVYSTLHYTENKEFVILPFLSVLLISPWMFLFRANKKIKKKQKETGKKWLFETTTSQIGELGSILNIIFQIGLQPFFYNKKMIWNSATEISFSIILVLFAITLYAAIHITPKKVKEILIKEHPEYKIS